MVFTLILLSAKINSIKPQWYPILPLSVKLNRFCCFFPWQVKCYWQLFKYNDWQTCIHGSNRPPMNSFLRYICAIRHWKSGRLSLRSFSIAFRKNGMRNCLWYCIRTGPPLAWKWRATAITPASLQLPWSSSSKMASHSGSSGRT